MHFNNYFVEFFTFCEFYQVEYYIFTPIYMHIYVEALFWDIVLETVWFFPGLNLRLVSEIKADFNLGLMSPLLKQCLSEHSNAPLYYEIFPLCLVETQTIPILNVSSDETFACSFWVVYSPTLGTFFTHMCWMHSAEDLRRLGEELFQISSSLSLSSSCLFNTLSYTHDPLGCIEPPTLIFSIQDVSGLYLGFCSLSWSLESHSTI